MPKHTVLCQPQEECSSTLLRVVACHQFPESCVHLWNQDCSQQRLPMALSSQALTATVGWPVSLNLNVCVACINGTSHFYAMMTGLFNWVTSGLLRVAARVWVPLPLETQRHCRACITQAVPTHYLLWMLSQCAWVCRCLWDADFSSFECITKKGLSRSSDISYYLSVSLFVCLSIIYLSILPSIYVAEPLYVTLTGLELAM